MMTLDVKIAPSMTDRTEIMLDANTGSGVSVQELINALCDVLDGESMSDIQGMTGLSDDQCQRIATIRDTLSPLWTDEAGKKILG